MHALTAEWFTAHRERMACWHHERPHDALEDIRRMEAEILELLEQRSTTPSRVTITPTDQEGNIVTTYAPGATATFTATSTNAEGAPVADTYTWTATTGTIVPGADDTTITISDAPVGDLTVTATNPAALSNSVTVTIADSTPASITVTAS